MTRRSCGSWGYNPRTADVAAALSQALAEILQIDPERGATGRTGRDGMDLRWHLRNGRADLHLECRSPLIRQEILAACWMLPGTGQVRSGLESGVAEATLRVLLTLNVESLRSSELDFVL